MKEVELPALCYSSQSFRNRIWWLLQLPSSKGTGELVIQTIQIKPDLAAG